jgi:hypothetical protein
MRNRARYRRHEADRVTVTLTWPDAVEVLSLVVAATLAESHSERRSALASLTANVAAALPA